MKNLKLGACISATLLMLAGTAFAGGICSEDGNGMCNCHNMQDMDHGKESASKSVFDGVMMKMHKAMGETTPTGNVDVDFVEGMIPHHQGAVDMAKIELAKGKDTVLKKMAEEIIKGQQGEIAIMQKWLPENKAK